LPYISQELRKAVDEAIKESTNICELKIKLQNLYKDPDCIFTFLIYWLMVHTYDTGSWTVKAKPLKILADIRLEYYRQILAPYADKKIEENGAI